MLVVSRVQLKELPVGVLWRCYLWNYFIPTCYCIFATSLLFFLPGLLLTYGEIYLYLVYHDFIRQKYGGALLALTHAPRDNDSFFHMGNLVFLMPLIGELIV